MTHLCAFTCLSLQQRFTCLTWTHKYSFQFNARLYRTFFYINKKQKEQKTGHFSPTTHTTPRQVEKNHQFRFFLSTSLVFALDIHPFYLIRDLNKFMILKGTYTQKLFKTRKCIKARIHIENDVNGIKSAQTRSSSMNF